MKTIYKAYDCENNPLFFESLTDLRKTLDLSYAETRRVGQAKRHAKLDNGTEVLIYRN